MVQWKSAQLAAAIGSTVKSMVEFLLSAIFVWSLCGHPKFMQSTWTGSESMQSAHRLAQTSHSSCRLAQNMWGSVNY
jgi:hypothetical protein